MKGSFGTTSGSEWRCKWAWERCHGGVRPRRNRSRAVNCSLKPFEAASCSRAASSRRFPPRSDGIYRVRRDD
jgi:hypothetical protein